MRTEFQKQRCQSGLDLLLIEGAVPGQGARQVRGPRGGGDAGHPGARLAFRRDIHALPVRQECFGDLVKLHHPGLDQPHQVHGAAHHVPQLEQLAAKQDR